MTLRVDGIDFESTDPRRVGEFWAAALGADLGGPDDEGVYWLERDGDRPDLLFIDVPEGKVVKNRLHLDLRPGDQAAEVARLEGLGARRIDIGQGDDKSWVVMADVEGNEFCVLRARRPDEG